jgi:lipopolysaccharide export system ATP-binding protein
MTQLSVSHLVKTYKGRHVVDDVSFFVDGGQVIGLLGPNGAGKTTSFYMAVGLIAPDKGHIFLNGQDVTTLPMHQRARLGMGYLPQEASVFRKLSVADNIRAILETRKDLTKTEQREKLESLMQEFHIAHLRDTLGLSLSGGERRRVEIARALAVEPAFILLDEPFAGVDPISVNDIKQIITHLKDKGIGILMTDHNVRETLTICDKAYIMNEGTILLEGDAQTILASQKVKEVYLGEQFTL